MIGERLAPVGMARMPTVCLRLAKRALLRTSLNLRHRHTKRSELDS